jgi:hypothetical protein
VFETTGKNVVINFTTWSVNIKDDTNTPVMFTVTDRPIQTTSDFDKIPEKVFDILNDFSISKANVQKFLSDIDSIDENSEQFKKLKTLTEDLLIPNDRGEPEIQFDIINKIEDAKLDEVTADLFNNLPIDIIKQNPKIFSVLILHQFNKLFEKYNRIPNNGTQTDDVTQTYEAQRIYLKQHMEYLLSVFTGIANDKMNKSVFSNARTAKKGNNGEYTVKYASDRDIATSSETNSVASVIANHPKKVLAVVALSLSAFCSGGVIIAATAVAASASSAVAAAMPVIAAFASTAGSALAIGGLTIAKLLSDSGQSIGSASVNIASTGADFASTVANNAAPAIQSGLNGLAQNTPLTITTSVNNIVQSRQFANSVEDWVNPNKEPFLEFNLDPIKYAGIEYYKDMKTLIKTECTNNVIEVKLSNQTKSSLIIQICPKICTILVNVIKNINTCIDGMIDKDIIPKNATKNSFKTYKVTLSQLSAELNTYDKCDNDCSKLLNKLEKIDQALSLIIDVNDMILLEISNYITAHNIANTPPNTLDPSVRNNIRVTDRIFQYLTEAFKKIPNPRLDDMNRICEFLSDKLKKLDPGYHKYDYYKGIFMARLFNISSSKPMTKALAPDKPHWRGGGSIKIKSRRNLRKTARRKNRRVTRR